MADLTRPSISFALDETIVELDRLHQTDQARRAGHLARLQVSVDRLGDGPPSDPEPQDVRARERASAAPPREPYVPPFNRSTHGGQPGPAVRAMLHEAALEKASRRW